MSIFTSRKLKVRKMKVDRKLNLTKSLHRRRTDRGRGAFAPPPHFRKWGAAPPPPPSLLQMVFFLHANAKVASRCRHAVNIAFDLFNIILYVIARKVRKCPLPPVVTSNVVLSGLVRLADILARLVQMADSLSALQLTGALFTVNWDALCQTHLPPPPPSHLLDRSAAPGL